MVSLLYRTLHVACTGIYCHSWLILYISQPSRTPQMSHNKSPKYPFSQKTSRSINWNAQQHEICNSSEKVTDPLHILFLRWPKVSKSKVLTNRRTLPHRHLSPPLSHCKRHIQYVSDKVYTWTSLPPSSAHQLHSESKGADVTEEEAMEPNRKAVWQDCNKMPEWGGFTMLPTALLLKI